MSVLNNYCETLKVTYPLTKTIEDLPGRLNLLLSDEVIFLNKSVYQRAQTAINDIFNYAHSTDYIQKISSKLSTADHECLMSPAKNSSVLMGYDFHYDQNTDLLSLIEINTNASAFLVSELLYKSKNISSLACDNAIKKLQSSFANELRLNESLKQTQSPIRAAIIDENISSQKMLIEFYMYKELFQNWGWIADIYEYNDPRIFECDFIYNRYTDFTFSKPESHALREAYLKNKSVMSPNPKEYILLADKSRFFEFSAAKISDVILPTEQINKINAEKMWEDRKKLFFKPRNQFGGKAAFRGASISRKYFDNLIESDFVAQEYRPAGEHKGWKFDLRFFVYQNEIQLTCARLYKGQVTNFGQQGGGLACVVFQS